MVLLWCIKHKNNQIMLTIKKFGTLRLLFHLKFLRKSEEMPSNPGNLLKEDILYLILAIQNIWKYLYIFMKLFIEATLTGLIYHYLCVLVMLCSSDLLMAAYRCQWWESEEFPDFANSGYKCLFQFSLPSHQSEFQEQMLYIYSYMADDNFRAWQITISGDQYEVNILWSHQASLFCWIQTLSDLI